MASRPNVIRLPRTRRRQRAAVLTERECELRSLILAASSRLAFALLIEGRRRGDDWPEVLSELLATADPLRVPVQI